MCMVSLLFKLCPGHDVKLPALSVSSTPFNMSSADSKDMVHINVPPRILYDHRKLLPCIHSLAQPGGEVYVRDGHHNQSLRDQKLSAAQSSYLSTFLLSKNELHDAQ
jgi:hypothetical protein